MKMLGLFKKRLAPPNLKGLKPGEAGEEWMTYLYRRKGYKILCRNFKVIDGKVLGELDIVCRQGKRIVIVEVKTRKSTRFGSPQEAVSAAKQAKLQRLAEYYIQEKGLTETPVRFDVVAVTLTGKDTKVEVISHAF